MKVFIILSLVCLAVPALGIDCSNCTGGCELEIQTCGTEARPCPPCADLCDKCTLIDNVGYLADPYDCRRFYQCMKDADNEWVVSEARWCADCTHWDSDLCTCSWADCSECANGHLFISDDNGASWKEYEDQGIVPATPTNSLFTSGATWTVDDQAVPGPANVVQAFAIDGKALRTLVHDPGTPGTAPDDATSWTLCFANCTYGSDGQLTPAPSEGSRYRYIYFAEKPENWCDDECRVVREVEDCSTPEPCPTPLVDDCPCMIHLEFENNLLDSLWNVSVIEHGVVAFGNECQGPAGYFDGQASLQLDFFNNYFNDNGDEFTVHFCIVPDGSAGTIMTNGCDDPATGGVDPTFWIDYDGKNVTVHLIVGAGCPVSVSAPYDGDCQCFLAYWDGAVLTLHPDGCADAVATVTDNTCDGHIKNTKCALTIGSDNRGPTSDDPDYYEGYLDDVIFCRTGDPLAVVADDCPCGLHDHASAAAIDCENDDGCIAGYYCNDNYVCALAR